MPKRKQASWPPETHTCGICGFTTPLISLVHQHIKDEHGIVVT